MADQEETPTVQIPVAEDTTESQEPQQDDGRGEDPAPTDVEGQKTEQVTIAFTIWCPTWFRIQSNYNRPLN